MEALRDRPERRVAAATLFLAAAAWTAVSVTDTMTLQPIAFVGAWALMMVAMMLPSVVPLVLVYARTSRVELLVAGYLLVWTAIGVGVYAVHRATDLMMFPSLAVAAVLVAAGVYQFTPLKDVCLKTCRSPVAFLMQRWRRSAFRLGVEHGAYCVGCCWGLMAVLVVAGAMDLVWALAIALVVFAEKVVPRGEATARVGGAALIAGGMVVAVV